MKSKSLYIFDFDDTLVHTDNKVRVINGNSLTLLSSKQFANYEKKDGDIFDFSDFETYPSNIRPIKKVFDIFLEAIKKHGVQNVVILTARSNGEDIKDVLVNLGISDQILVFAVGNAYPKAKALVIKNIIKKNIFTNFHLYEDSIRNINAIKNAFKTKKCNLIVNYVG